MVIFGSQYSSKSLCHVRECELSGRIFPPRKVGLFRFLVNMFLQNDLLADYRNNLVIVVDPEL